MKKSEWKMRLVLALALCLPLPLLAEDLALVDLSSAVVRWDVQTGDFEKMVLTVSGPDGNVVRREFKAGQPVVFELDTAAKDGAYRYELVGAPRVETSVRRELAAARKAGNEAAVIERLMEAGRLPREGAVQSGSFLVKDGAIIGRDVQERPQTAAAAGGPQIITAADQVIPDDLIVQGSGCFGLDCVNNESFGFDTIRMKENNTRIKFEDTSVGTFPTNDWQLTANDSASGGASKFSIEDITGARVPFTITAGASTNSIFVDSTGRVGFRTSTPVLDLHVATSNTPAIRLEQNSSGGFTAQTWDIGANEANFFVRDVTGGSKLSFRIRPGAPTSSIDISADGDVGVGTASPDSKLHVEQSDGAAEHLIIQDTNGTAALRTFINMKNNGGSRLNFTDSSSGSDIVFGINNNGGTMNWLKSGTGVTAMTLTGTGGLTINGTLTQGSSRELKTNFASLEPRDVLSRVTALPISLWSYKTEGEVRHVGPMAEDFHKFFGLGEDARHIAPGDQAGVALAAIQGLNQVVEEKDKEIADLKSRLETLEKLVEGLAKTEPQQ
jgi:hypothetical protein